MSRIITIMVDEPDTLTQKEKDAILDAVLLLEDDGGLDVETLEFKYAYADAEAILPRGVKKHV